MSGGETGPLADQLPADEGALWELYHMNSKTTPSDLFAPSEVIAETMRQMPLSFRALSRPLIPLPRPDGLKTPAHGLQVAMLDRRTPQNFRATSLSLSALATLLYACGGQNRTAAEAKADRPFRVVPSGGALYPLEIYVHCRTVEDLPPGIYHYDHDAHGLRVQVEGDQTDALSRIVVQPNLPRDTAIQILFTMIPARLALKYGERGYRFALFEAGHASQNAIVAARAMSLDAVPIGGYKDEMLERLLGIDGVNHVAAYLTFVGQDDDG